jgi:hypothetical protein
MAIGKVRGAIWLFSLLTLFFAGSTHAVAINSIQTPALVAIRTFIPILATRWTDAILASSTACDSSGGNINDLTCDAQGRVTEMFVSMPNKQEDANIFWNQSHLI